MKNSYQVLSAILVLLLTFPGFSQAPIYQADILKKGIYRNFQELKTNNPSIPMEYKVEQFQEGFDLFKASNLAKSYKLIIDKSTGKEFGKVYGFCDGINVYINPEEPSLRPDTPFSKIEDLDAISYFESNDCVRERSGGWNCSRKMRILDFQTGQVTQLTVGNFNELISDDPALQNQFKKEKKKKDRLQDYVWLYLARKRENK